MSICWWCYWGWPKPIAEIYTRAEREIDELLPVPGPENNWTEWQGEPTCGESALQYGPAHVVWADENWNCAEGCLEDCDQAEYATWLQPALEIVRRSLRELIALPKELKESPADYDDENPEKFPPTHNVEMVRPRS